MKVGIIGGGIIGLSSAYYLNKAGHDVTILEQGNLVEGCSLGNAGMIVPSHFIPMASPGMISKGIRWMFNSKSPFYIKPRFDGELIKWGYQFYRHATKDHVTCAIPALKEISLLSKSLFTQWSAELPFDFGFQQWGLMMLYQTKETEREEIETARLANQIGIEAHVLNLQEVQKLEPEVKVNVRGGIYFPGDAHITPDKLYNELAFFLEQQGVQILTNCEVKDFEIEERSIKMIKTKWEEFTFDEVVLASGSWSGLLGKKLEINLPMQAGKGYSFTLHDRDRNVQIPSIFLEARVAVTPMGNRLRFGGTLEITDVDHSINVNRVKGIVESIPHYYPELNVPMPSLDQVWHGLRPCSPDGLPFIGRSSHLKNLTVATGHSMMGISLAPATGKLVAELIDRQKPSMEIDAFHPDRF